MKKIVNAVIPSVPTVQGVQGSAVLTESEEQAVQYVASYVLMKLKKENLKVKCSPEAIDCLECLTAMHGEEGRV